MTGVQVYEGDGDPRSAEVELAWGRQVLTWAKSRRESFFEATVRAMKRCGDRHHFHAVKVAQNLIKILDMLIVENEGAVLLQLYKGNLALHAPGFTVYRNPKERYDSMMKELHAILLACPDQRVVDLVS
jgi:hypothetical protein